MMQTRRQIAGTSFRLPDELKKWLKHRAIDNGRSSNSEVLQRLEESRQRDVADRDRIQGEAEER